MFKFILKVFAVAAAVAAALAALSWFDKAGTPEYIEIYSDDEDAFEETSRSVQRRVRGAPSLFRRKPPRTDAFQRPARGGLFVFI